jgi:hypothetical protein
MKLRFSPIVFMLAYCLVYTAALLWDLPAFLYYPLGGHFSWGPTVVEGLGPAMAWYGILAEAALIAAILAVIVPDRWFADRMQNVLWTVPVAAMLICTYLMRIFFG